MQKRKKKKKKKMINNNIYNSRMDSRNFLNKNDYIINESLHKSLENEKLDSELELSNKDIYMTVFKPLDFEKKKLIYGYMPYNKIFLETLLVYILVRNKILVNFYREPGHFLTVVDDDNTKTDNLQLNEISFKLGGITEELASDYYSGFRTDETFKIINRLVYFTNCKNISNLIELAFNKQYSPFIKEILSFMPDYDKYEDKILKIDDSFRLNILKSSVFILEQCNVKSLLNDIRDRGYEISAGPRAQRGRVNSINQFLSILDQDYRNSLYLHNSLHAGNGNILSRHKLDRKKFTFNNIHMNLGSVKYYSTKSTYIEKETIPSNKDFLSACFTELVSLFQTKYHDEKLQLEIEEYLFDCKNAFYNSIIEDRKPTNYSQKSSEFIIEKTEELTAILERDYDEVNLNYGNLKQSFFYNLRLTSEIVRELGAKKTANVAISYFLTILNMEKLNKNFGIKSVLYEEDSYPIDEDDESYVDDTELGHKPIKEIFCNNQLGNSLFNMYKYKLYSKSDTKKYKFFEWCELDENKKNFNRFKEDISSMTGIGGNILFLLTQPPISLIYVKAHKLRWNRGIRLIYIEKKALDIMSVNKVASLPYKLPMIVKPKPYELIDGKITYGGYLLNGDKYLENLFISKPLYNIPTSIEEPENILQMVNDVSSVSYMVNKEVFEYLLKYGVNKGMLMNYEKDILPKKSKKKLKEYKSLLSKYNMENLIMEIAQTFSLVDKFYFPLRLDNRTRIYADCEYFNYQTTDLAKSLLLFSEPDYIYKHDELAIKYFKSFGAVLYGGNNSRKSLNKRAQWVDEHDKEISNFKNNDMVPKSKDKASFLAFCIEYVKFKDFLNDVNRSKFETRLPIQVDASCNGYQHLSLLTRDENALKYLNLNKSSYNDDPYDFYTLIISKFKKLISYDIDNGNYNNEDIKESLIKILSMKLTRNELKGPIMTFAYNARSRTMTFYLSDKMELKKVKVDNNNDNESDVLKYKEIFNLPGEKDGFEWNELCLIITYIKKAVSEFIPKMNELNNYMKSLVKICTKFNIPLPRKLPSGAVVSESYIESKSQQSTPIAFLNKTKYTFKVPVKNKKGEYVYNKRKMTTAIMPNVVHSLDATAIAMLYELLKSPTNLKKAPVNNIYTVHDCFAMTANNINRLMECLKNTYIKMYSDNVYLLEMDKYVRNHIEQSLNTKFNEQGNSFKNPDTGRYLRYPNVNDVINTKISIVDIKNSSNILT